MMIAYMEAVARDQAADRGCTGGGEVADDTGPPGEIPCGFSFWELPIDPTAFSALFVHPGLQVGQTVFLLCPQLAVERLTGELA